MNTENYISSGIIEQYVLGLCSADDVQEIAKLRKQHPLIDTAIIQYEMELEAMYTSKTNMSIAEPTNYKILSALKDLQPTQINNQKTEQTRLVSFNWFKIAAAAAVLLLAVSVFFNYLLYKKNNDQAVALTKKVPQLSLPINNFDVLKNPAITPIAMMGQGYHAICRCTMFWDKNTGKAYVMVHHLIKSGTTYDYQLWAIVDGKKVSVGLIDDDIRNQFVELNGMPNNATEFIVTLEKAGGALVPDEDVILKGKI